MSDFVILFFLRYPRIGQVKTRLAREVGEKNALDLYVACVSDMLEVLDASALATAILVASPQDVTDTRLWLGQNRLYVPQQGDDLGQRQKNAFRWAFGQGFQSAMLIGSDLPWLKPIMVHTARRLLQEKQAILGPSTDGGYWCIGFNHDSYVPEAFDRIPWGGSEVLVHTRERIKDKNIGYLPTRRDMDVLADLIELYQESPEALGPRTLAIAREILAEKN